MVGVWTTGIAGAKEKLKGWFDELNKAPPLTAAEANYIYTCNIWSGASD